MGVENVQVAQAPDSGERRKNEPGLLQVLTLVVWLTWAAIGVIGLLTAHARPRPGQEPNPLPPLQAELVNVELTDEPPIEIAAAAPSPADESEPPPPEADVPPLPAVALPSPAIAFAVPVEGPVRIVGAREANPARLPMARAVVHRLAYGQDDGGQPRPDYPEEAQAAGQEGVVVIRFMVDANGRVVSAEVATPSPWPSLNQAALRTVRDRWHFAAGMLRPHDLYDKPFRFQLNRQ